MDIGPLTPPELTDKEMEDLIKGWMPSIRQALEASEKAIDSIKHMEREQEYAHRILTPVASEPEETLKRKITIV